MTGRRLAALVAAAALAGCAATPPAAWSPASAAPPAWVASVAPPADAGETARADGLATWWRQFDDPLLPRLVDAAQAASPTLAVALARLAQARAARAAVEASAWPSVDAGTTASRGRPDLGAPTGTRLGAELRASWELDLFGRLDAATDAAQARIDGARAGWHDARVALAADVGVAYVSLRACEAQRLQALADSASRDESARLTTLAADAGLRPPAAAALARASAAQARAQAEAQRQRCDLELKSLVALTGLAEPELRARLDTATARLPRPAAIVVDTVPAQALAQRPDLAAAERRVVAAAADTAQAQADRLPRVTLAGSLGASRLDAGSVSTQGTVWTLGPLRVTLPWFDGGSRVAAVDAARARYDEAVAQYATQLRQAVREVESALVTLQGTAARRADAEAARDGYQASLRATDALYRGGLASLFELEDARRTALAAQRELIDLERERLVAWISLYRALGGGWSATDPVTTADAATAAPGRSSP